MRWALGRSDLPVRPNHVPSIFLAAFATVTLSANAFCQTTAFGPLPVPSLESEPSISEPSISEPSIIEMPDFDVSALPAGTFDQDAVSNGADPHPEQPRQGLIRRSVKRILGDQKGIYFSPLEPAHFKYDAVTLAGTAAFLITDRRIENNLPGGHFKFYQDTSDIAIAGLATTLGGVWLYGIKGDHPHARETGELELETLVNTFLVYTPMQFIAGRWRPGEGTGNGDFLKHHMINTSFPGGHAMFTWAMATVVAHEYSQPWVRVLNYSAAFTVTLTRFLARDHWASDMWVGTALGLGIGTYTFHQHCDPELSDSCKRHYARIAKRTTKSKLDHMPFSPQWNAEVNSGYSSARPISQ